MTPDDAEQIHQTRRELAALARTNNWQTTLPHSDRDWIWMHCYRQDDGARLAVEWCDDLPTGCRLTVTLDAHDIAINVHGRHVLEWALGNRAWLHAAHGLARHLAATETVIDLRDEP